MTSLIAWLDASSEDQRRMREIVNLFSERESRDELGIGQVRDALSDRFGPAPQHCSPAPGTSSSSRGASALQRRRATTSTRPQRLPTRTNGA